MAGFDADKVLPYEGRTKANVPFIDRFCIDIEGSAENYERNPDGGYSDAKTARMAVADFVKATTLTPGFLVSTGSGGIHLYFVLDAPVTPFVWIGRARALVVLARKHCFKINAQCTTDATRRTHHARAGLTSPENR